ncbi:hypothetical protein TrispH2_011845 [Trichoplax sp. H2]|nr:hypothetical protein TrispH2_011845 [Trichoplax sp. H2]|eukprot:RDD36164.1 hypothetical protein TrispH2_011845 [Trichoplax sp. H2]
MYVSFYITIAAQRYFNLIIKDIGAEWKDLARVLDFDQTRIKTITANNLLDVDDQCAEMLHVQHNTKGKSFNKLELIKALYKANLGAVAEKINIDHEITQDPGSGSQKALNTNKDQGQVHKIVHLK